MAKRGRVEQLNRILHHEMEASATYDELLGEPAKSSSLWDLYQIGIDHRQAVGELRSEITQLGGDPETEGGSRHYWPPLPEESKTLRLNENPRLLSALQQGELLEIEECRKVLNNGNLRDEARDLLERHLLPNLLGHVRTLSGYLKASHHHHP